MTVYVVQNRYSAVVGVYLNKADAERESKRTYNKFHKGTVVSVELRGIDNVDLVMPLSLCNRIIEFIRYVRDAANPSDKTNPSEYARDVMNDISEVIGFGQLLRMDKHPTLDNAREGYNADYPELLEQVRALNAVFVDGLEEMRQMFSDIKSQVGGLSAGPVVYHTKMPEATKLEPELINEDACPEGVPMCPVCGTSGDQFCLEHKRAAVVGDSDVHCYMDIYKCEQCGNKYGVEISGS